jgi:tryptophan synthase alpha chain
MAVTGSATDSVDVTRVVKRVRDCSDLPTYVGIGISTPQQARAAVNVSDGVIVGSALVRVIHEGGGAREIEQFIGSFRNALDAAGGES